MVIQRGSPVGIKQGCWGYLAYSLTIWLQGRAPQGSNFILFNFNFFFLGLNSGMIMTGEVT